MYDFHKDKKRYFNYQYRTAKEHILPFVDAFLPSDKPRQILEIGCAEAGVLKAFLENGDQCLGIELLESRTALAKEFHKEAVSEGRIKFLNKNIYDIDIAKDIGHKFDLIILKDVIEHIPDQEKIIPKLKEFLNKDGKIFFGFPPWCMPFGGHQQICENKLLKKLPYFHLLPMPIYKMILKSFGESEKRIVDLEEIKDTGISIERFRRIVKQSGLTTYKKQDWLFNPIYEYKFNVKPKKQIGLISGIPYLRNFFTTAVYYLVG